MLDERLLNRIQLVRRPEPFNRRDFAVLRFDREQRARIHRLAINEHRACATSRPVANLLRARKVQPVPQRIQERDTRLEVQLFSLPVNFK